MKFGVILFAIGWCFLTSELILFSLFVYNINDAWTNRNSRSNNTSSDYMSITLFLGKHILSCTVIIIELLLRVGRVMFKKTHGDSFGFIPATILVPVILVVIETADYLQLTFLQHTQMHVISQLWALIESCGLFIWTLVVSIYLYKNYFFGVPSTSRPARFTENPIHGSWRDATHRN